MTEDHIKGIELIRNSVKMDSPKSLEFKKTLISQRRFLLSMFDSIKVDNDKYKTKLKKAIDWIYVEYEREIQNCGHSDYSFAMEKLLKYLRGENDLDI